MGKSEEEMNLLSIVFNNQAILSSHRQEQNRLVYYIYVWRKNDLNIETHQILE